MVSEIGENQWEQFLKIHSLPIFFKPAYLKSVANSFKIEIAYYVLKEGEDIKVALAVYIKGRNIVSPENFTYTPFWILQTLDERQQITAIEALLSHLKTQFSKITLRLGINVLDIRPFIWAGFKIDNRYTFIKDPFKPNHYSIAKNLKHKYLSRYQCTAHEPDEASIDININFLRKLGYSGAKAQQFKRCLSNLSENSFLKAFSLKTGKVYLGSSLILVDQESFKAYMLVSNPIDRKEKYAHTLLYYFSIEALRDNGIKEIDFCGANMETIAYFKSFFNPELKPYFMVKYSSHRQMLKPIFRLLDRI